MSVYLLPKDVLNYILQFLVIDGKSAVYCRRVCKKWKTIIDNNEKMKEYIEMHYIRINDEIDLEYLQDTSLKRIPFDYTYIDKIWLNILDEYNYKDYNTWKQSPFIYLDKRFDIINFDNDPQSIPVYFINDSRFIIRISTPYKYLENNLSLKKLQNIKQNFILSNFTWKYISISDSIKNSNIIYNTGFKPVCIFELIFEIPKEPENKKIKVTL